MDQAEIQKITQKIKNCEALALNPGTPAEGENAKNAAINLSTLYNIPCIFTDNTLKRESNQYKPKIEKPKLHSKIIELETCLSENNWKFSYYRSGKRIYLWGNRPNEEIHIGAQGHGSFYCQHLYKPTNMFRDLGNSIYSINAFFDSISYRYGVWNLRPKSENKEKWIPVEDFANRVDVIDDMLLGKKKNLFESYKFKKHSMVI